MTRQPSHGMRCDSAIVNLTLQWKDDKTTSKHVLSVNRYNLDTCEDTLYCKWILLQKIWRGQWDKCNDEKPTIKLLEYVYICIIYIPIIHNGVSKYEWIPPPWMAGAPKLKNLKTTTQGTPRRERPNWVYGGSIHTLQRWWCIYERTSL